MLNIRHVITAIAVVTAALVLVDTARAQVQWNFDDVDRIVAVADIHGAYEAFETILKQAEVIDDALRWTGNDTHLVIVGDVVDRGPESRAALDLIMRLEDEARTAGGRVHMVLGNHEIMNMTGDLRYVSDAEYAAFADDETPGMRDTAFAQIIFRAQAPIDDPSLRAEFDSRYPPGFFAHRAAFAAGGRYGSWLLKQPMLLVIDGWAFVHAGIAATGPATTAAAINGDLIEQLAEYMSALDGLIAAGVLSPGDDFYAHPEVLAQFASRVESGIAQWPEGAELLAQRISTLNAADVFASDSPVWYRGNVGCSELTEEQELLDVLSAFSAKQLVIGHTPTAGATVQHRMERQLIRIDTGMLTPYYGGRAAALVIEGDRVTVLYENEPLATSTVPQPVRVGDYPSGMSPSDLERFLATAAIVNRQELDTRWQQLTLRDGDIELVAYFTPADRASVRADVAAYRLDRLLDLQMVPVAVARDVDGVSGSLQYAPPQTITETERAAGTPIGGAWCPLGEQFDSMYVFDSLIYNLGRTTDRIRYRLDNMQLLLLGHDASFSTARGTPSHLASVDLKISEDWDAALHSLDEKLLTETLGDVLDRRRIRAVLARRDEILERAAEN